ncbi:hypothetical protein SLS62_010089 [Diatrype stigma]|uniref:Uncharacterized protein n=1 Tax=Diatrype stigma TaxID=117547 RepID=A0AAN9UDQ3_9PEZI
MRLTSAPAPTLRIKSLLITLGPFLLPKAIAWYRSARASASRPDRPPIAPLRGPALRAVVLLLVAALFLLGRALLPALAPENVFVATQSRLQIPTEVLFTRLSSLRPGHALTPRDDALRARFVNLESRLLYLQYGPDVLASCPFCGGPDDARASGGSSYFYYALPALLAPHLLNLFVASIATTPGLLGGAAENKQRGANNGSGSGSNGGSDSDSIRRWRSLAAAASVALAALDVYLTQSYNAGANARATRLAEVDMFFWRSRAGRLAALAVLDGALAAAIYLAATNRAFLRPLTPAGRAARVAGRLVAAKAKLGVAGVVRNSVLRDADLRARMADYWAREAECVREAREDRDVLEGVNDALVNRIRIQDIERDAERYALGMLPRVEDEEDGEDEEGEGEKGKRRAEQKTVRSSSSSRETVVG